ncbi:hypothetical protein BJX63DRAFT_992 [Aspergillus granulosus]|uniref:Uncharacterized protein n=1 Tax=Aspergillus granulosus TaxID=176169 RepID=A0ABR4I558_9EURO
MYADGSDLQVDLGAGSYESACHLLADGQGIVSTHYPIKRHHTGPMYQWNPAIKNDCAEGFWLGNAHCVGVAN